MNILFATTVIPFGKTTGGEIASSAFLNSFKELGHNVDVVGYLRKSDPRYTAEIVERRNIETKTSGIDKYLWMLMALIKKEPYTSYKYLGKRYFNKLGCLLAANSYDLVIVDHIQLLEYGKYIKSKSKSPIIMISHNFESNLYREESSHSSNLVRKYIYNREYRLMCKYEDTASKIFDQIWCLTTDDKADFLSIGGNNIKAFDIPSSLSFVSFNNIKKKYDIGLIGTWSWGANYKGLRWFMDSVLPTISPVYSVAIAGRRGDIESSHYPNVCFLGYVDDAIDFIQSCKVIAVPSVSGSGIQIKTLDAISCGVALVATSIAVRGISYLPSSVVVNDNALEFSNLLIKSVQQSENIDYKTISMKWSNKRKRDFVGKINLELKNLELLK